MTSSFDDITNVLVAGYPATKTFVMSSKNKKGG
jgi:hypothetical protein